MADDAGISPLRLIWFRPTEAMAVIARRPGPAVALAAVAGALGLLIVFAPALPPQIALRGRDVVLLPALTGLLALVSIAGLYLSGWVTNALARGFGGDGSAGLTRAAIAWSQVIAIPFDVVALPLILYLKSAPAANVKLSLALFLAGVMTSIWSFVVFIRMLGYANNLSLPRAVVVALLQFVILLGAAVGFRVFIAQPFVAVNSSMVPTLISGDLFAVSKRAYGYSRYSFPFAPRLFSGRVRSIAPARGDLVVFRHPVQAGRDDVSRVIGLPGDRVQMRQGRLYINDRIAERRQISPAPAPDLNGKMTAAATYEETLPGGPTHLIVELRGDNGAFDETKAYTVPEGHYFMLGDNRDNSLDSRADQKTQGVGFVPAENLIGRGEGVFFSVRQDDPSKPAQIDWARIGLRLR
jgi:signal peptidase I